jgi:hypothetical protein
MSTVHVQYAHLESSIHEKVGRCVVLAATVVVIDRVPTARAPKPVLVHNKVSLQVVRSRVDGKLAVRTVVYDRLVVVVAAVAAVALVVVGSVAVTSVAALVAVVAVAAAAGSTSSSSSSGYKGVQYDRLTS